jgi:hypothetical protein
MSFCSIHVACIRPVKEKYRSLTQILTNVPTKEVSNDSNKQYDDDYSSDERNTYTRCIPL